MGVDDGDRLARYASYGFVLSSMVRVNGEEVFSASSEAYRWKLRCIRTKMRHLQYDDDRSFLQDVHMLLQCACVPLVREGLTRNVLSSMTFVGLGNELPVLLTNHHTSVAAATNCATNMPILSNIMRRDIQLGQQRTTASAQALQASLAALEALASPQPLDLSKAHPSLLRRTSSMLKAKKALALNMKKPKPMAKLNENIVYKDGRKVYIPLEPEIVDKQVLQVLQPRRRQVQVNMCPHLQGQQVTVYSAKRDRVVSEEPLGELRDGQVYDIQSERLLTFERFFATHVKANRHGRLACQHICLLAPERQSLDLHLLACDHYTKSSGGAEPDDLSSEVATDEDVPLSKLLENASSQAAQNQKGPPPAPHDTTPSKKRGRGRPRHDSPDPAVELNGRRTSKRLLGDQSPPPSPSRKSARVTQKDLGPRRASSRQVESTKPPVRRTLRN